MNPVEVKNIVIGEGIPKICVPIVGISKQEILEQAEQIGNTSADMVEWRADWYQSVDNLEAVGEVLKELHKVIPQFPTLFTFRTKEEGGERPISDYDYLQLNKWVIDSGLVDLVDVEVFSKANVLENIVTYAHSQGVKVVGSNHDFQSTPEKAEIIRRLSHMQDHDCDILKMAVMPKDHQDVMRLLIATDEMVSKYALKPVVTMSMSEIGRVSRIIGEVSGSAITFGTIGKASAPGQIEASELKEALQMIHGAV